MRKLFWRLRCVYWYWHYARLPLRVCWGFSGGCVEMAWDDEMTPREAVETDMQCWGED